MSYDNCKYFEPKETRCSIDAIPESVCVRSRFAHIASPAVKAWLLGTCVNGALVYSLVTDNGATPISGPSATPLSGPIADWAKVDCGDAVVVQNSEASNSSGLPVAQGPLTNQKTIAGADCVGGAVSSGVIGSVETIPNAVAVQKTKDCDTPLVLAGLAAIVTELQKPEYAPMVTQCRTPDGKRWAHYTIMNEQTQVFSNQYLDITTGVAQTTAPVGLDCSSDEKIDTVDLYACRNSVEIFGYALLDTISRLVVGEVWRDPATGLWGALPTGSIVGKCQQSSLVLNAVWRCEELVAKQAKAWYEPSTGALVRVNDLVTGADATQSWVASGFNEGQAPSTTQSIEKVYYNAPAIDNTYLGLFFIAPLAATAEIRATIDGAIQFGNGAGVGIGGNWPVATSVPADVCAYLNNLPGNTAPQDVWALDPVNNWIYITNTVGGIAPNHTWDDVYILKNTNNNADNLSPGGYAYDFRLSQFGAATPAQCQLIYLTTTRNACGVSGPIATDASGAIINSFNPLFVVETCVKTCKVACQTNAVDATTILNSMENF